MNIGKIALAAVTLASLSFTLAPGEAAARYWRHHHRHYYGGCAAARHRHARNGTIIGAVGGGLIGNAVTHGSAGGTLLGAGAGAVAGHEVGRTSSRC
jgi:hypothetical protein